MAEHLRCRWYGPRPFVHPLRTTAGDVLTVDAPDDHPWHHGLWFTIKYVNGENFWEEYGEFGTLRTRSAARLPGGVRGTVDWVRPDGTSVVLRETRTITEVAVDADTYVVHWHEELVPEVQVVLDRTPYTTWGGYGGLTLRGAPDWTDTTLVLPDGTTHEQLRGERAAWCALTGTTAAGRQAAVAIIPEPGHPREPIPWYASTRADTYGEGWANFLNAAFLWDEAFTVPAGTALTLAYRVVVTTASDGLDAREVAQRVARMA